jgi:YidC/Oxa1 family membrane protein insertase
LDKRFLLAIALSALVLIGYSFLSRTLWPKPANPPSAAALPGASGAPSGTAAASGGAAPGAAGSTTPSAAGANAAESVAPIETVAPVSPVRAADSEQELELVFGSAGRPGYWRARFTNRGARLLELSAGDYVDRVGYGAEERLDWGHHLDLLVPVPTPDGPTGSLELAALDGAGALLREPLERALWTTEVERGDGGQPTAVVFRYAPGTGAAFEKRVAPVAGTWELAVEIALANESAAPSAPGTTGGLGAGKRNFRFTPAACVPEELGDKFYVEPRAVAAGRWSAWGSAEDETVEYREILRSSGADDMAGSFELAGPITFAGAHSKYFAVLMRGATEVDAQSMFAAAYRRIRGPAPNAASHDQDPQSPRFLVADVSLELELPAPGAEETRRSYRVYAGPKRPAELTASFGPHRLVLEKDLGWFSGIGRFLLLVLGFFERLVGNWGVAIVLLTIAVRLALFPLNRRSQTAMARYQKKMKRVQPRIEELKQRYAKEPDKLRTEQARIMQEEGAFPPLGGCLPMFLQLPVFFGLFSALRTSFELRQAPFALWITDLSLPDRMFALGWDVNLLFTTVHVAHFNLLPILMTVLWVVQQLVMPKPTDPQAAQMQKIMLFMPVLMGFFLYGYAAGLSLYMITQSALGILEQTVVKRLWPIDDREVERKGGCAPFAKLMAQAAENQKRQKSLLASAKRRR